MSVLSKVPCAALSNASRQASRLSRPRAVSTLSAQTPVSKGPTKYGGVYTATLIPGDGVGKEITDSVKEIFDNCNVPVEWEQCDVSGDPEGSASQFQQAMDSLRRNKVGLKGTLFTPTGAGSHNSWNVAMRQQLDIYASMVFCKTLKGVPTRHSNVDFVIIRENTEGEYSGLEHSPAPGIVESLKVSTRFKAERISRLAFDFALKNNRKKVTCVHKANIMKLGDGLFLNTFRRVAEEYKSVGIEPSEMIVDNTSMQLVGRPDQFDVMVMPNLYGNIVSNIGAALVGGPGTVPGANIGRDYALYEPGSRHVARDIMGTNKANPTAMVLSATMMLRHFGLDYQANLITAAVYRVISEGKVRTADLGGNATTQEFTQAVLQHL
ncbi:isocitrate dehydrogenase (NAD(+)) [Malassezia vespertilionis]|uniref:isocitrate dehydrogenase (NAD(+)) n=1 Tax=Malassezia vespertilionis TaxID=2020962 RepID=UPI0024B20E29|nr:isocitrate dehydrogenase (NAD(+)) [Malassezia vespertilionis]WFD05923.1 isocitrate dehydrogenase (NAD(+)) [Malassezia vespertilionis]